MRFSIIIPVYNAEQFLEKCINSVISQSFTDYEMILINDGSKDRSEEICRQASEERGNIKYLSQKNAGPSSARNRGIEAAVGEYIVFLDADDKLETEGLATLNRIVSEHTPDVILSGEKIRNREDEALEIEYLELDADSIHKGKASALEELSKKRFCLLTHKIVVRRSILCDNKIRFNEDYRIGEDIMMMAQTVCCCETFRLNPVPYYIYNNYNTNSLMHTVSFERIWKTTDICSDLFEQAITSKDCEKQLLLTTVSMLLVGFLKYYRVFAGSQKQQIRKWLAEHPQLLSESADTLAATKLAKQFIGAKNAYLLAGFVASVKGKE